MSITKKLENNFEYWKSYRQKYQIKRKIVKYMFFCKYPVYIFMEVLYITIFHM